MRHLNETTDISILSQFDMRTGYPAVVQKVMWEQSMFMGFN